MNKRVRMYVLFAALLIAASLFVPMLLEAGTEMFVEKVTSYTEWQEETGTESEMESETQAVPNSQEGGKDHV